MRALWMLLSLTVAASASCATAPIVAPYPGRDADSLGAPTAAADPNAGQPVLWQVRSTANSAPPSYLLGAVAAGVDGRTELPASVWEALHDCERTVVRTDSWNIDPQLFTARCQRLDKRFTQEIDSQAWGLMREAMGSLYADDQLDKLQPWYVARNILALLPLKSGRHPIPIEVEVTARAQLADQRLVPLESWIAQIDTLEQIYGTEELLTILSNLPAEKSRLEGLGAAYRQGDLAAVERLLYSEFDPATRGALKELWVRARLERWWNPLRGEFDRGGSFVVLGLEHILGADGMLRRLSDAGFEVSRVGLQVVPATDSSGTD